MGHDQSSAYHKYHNGRGGDQLGTMVTFPSTALLTLNSSASSICAKVSTLYEVVARSPLSHALQLSLIHCLRSSLTVAYQLKSRQPVMWIPFDRLSPTVMVRGFDQRQPQMWTQEPGFRLRMRNSVMGPPPRASKNTLKPWVLIASTYSASQLPLVTTTCCAPSDLRRVACSSLRTMFSSGIPRVWQNLLSILPRAEEAPVWMMPLLPGVALQISVMPTTVSGLMMPEAAECRGTSSEMGKTFSGVETAYSPHEPDPS